MSNFVEERVNLGINLEWCECLGGDPERGAMDLKTG